MSDFDKEAEREKLREKYESEEDDREVAEKMSELLLQGATMTNAHCSECGDPIFRYDGQEFCATCEKAVQRDTGDEQGEDEDSENIEVTTPDENARVAFGGESQQSQAESASDQQQAHSAGDQRNQQTQNQSTPAQQSASDQQHQRAQKSARQNRQPQQTATQPSGQPEQSREVPGVEPTAGGDIAAARASLERTLTRFAQQAEATEDPQRASEYLAAAREAAETLAALRQ